ncbi:MAG: DDE-type integrase/transposase/recombinase, partial [Pseudolabrys sp.]
MKHWLTAAEIATAQLAGLPTVKRAVNRVAAAQSWRGQPRCGRGGGVEYHIDSLPVAARADYFARHLQAIDVPASVARDAAIEPQAEAVAGPATEARDARLALLAAADRYAVAARMGHKRADAHFCDRYNLGEIEIADWIKDEVKALSPRTLKRWRSLSRAGKRSQLAVDRGASRRNTGILDRANDGAVKTFALAVIVKQPQLTAHHIRALVADRFDGALLVGGRSISVPPIRTFQYALKAWRVDNRVALEAARNPDGFKNTMRFAARVTSPASHLNEVWQIDASPADVMCVDGRYAIYVAIDVYSRRVIGLVSKTPRASAVGLLLRKCILTWGVPDRIKSDNGSDFIARETQRLFAGLAIEHEKARPFTPEQKGHVERVIGTLQRGLMRTLPGFVGHSVADRTVIRSRKSFADRLGEAADDTFQVELTGADLQAKVDDWCNVIYANAPHSSLKGQTPFAVAAMAGGAIRRISDVRALDMLLMPVAGKDGVRTVTKTGLRID